MQAYVAHRTELLRFLVARTGDAGEAEDIVQELWLRLAAARVDKLENPRAYLFRAAHNLATDRQRSRWRSARRDTLWCDDDPTTPLGAERVDPQSDVEALLIEHEEAAALAAAIARLPRRAGEAFRLHKLDGVSHADVATHMGISESGVEKHMAAAMAFLRRALQN
jgi:RNA polymerase sigma-70 factor (ECF subfamily)